MIPTRRFLLLLALGLLPALLVWMIWPDRRGLFGAALLLGSYDLLLVILAALDWRRMEKPSDWQVVRSIPKRFMIGEENRIEISLRLPVGRPLQIRLRDEYPIQLEPRDPTEMLIQTSPPLAAGHPRVAYRLFADRRGKYDFGDIVLRWPSRYGLLIRQARIPAAESCRVYPNIVAAQRHVTTSRAAQIPQYGVRLSRYRGQGREFESLRDYVTGDQLRHVSWTATARRGRLTTRQYQVERNQSILIMLDTGRLMTARIDRLTKLDHAINAALSIAAVAIRTGDLVGLLAFEREVVRYLPPQRGRGQLISLLESLYDLEPRLIEPSYPRAFEYLHQHCRKRSLVIILTDLIDGDTSTDLLACTAALLPRHLPLIVAIGDQDLHAVVGQPPAAIRDVYRRSVATEMLQQREEALGHILERGGLALDIKPGPHSGDLSSRLVHQYLEVKARGLL
jgi:uncharacterized protein (DUF58 family)